VAARPIPDRIERATPSLLSRAGAIALLRLPGPVRVRMIKVGFGRAQKAFNRGDLEVVFAAFADDVEYMPPPLLPECRPLRGKEAVIEYWREVFDHFEVNRIENLELWEPAPGIYMRRATLFHGARNGEFLRYEIEQRTEFRHGQVVRQENRIAYRPRAAAPAPATRIGRMLRAGRKRLRFRGRG
jgi:ketosteroid isomerase-like protein